MRFRSTAGESRQRSRGRVLGNILIVLGVISLLVAGFAYVADPSRAEQSLPRPVALDNGTDSTTEPALPTTPPATPGPEASKPTAVPAAPIPSPLPTAAIPTPTPVPPDPPVRMVIKSIYVDSRVQEIGTAYKDGQLIWETVPYVVGHYRTSAMPGQNGNAIFAGHVTSQNLGNVFINLWQVEIGDEVHIYTGDRVYTYAVNKVRLVLPTDVSVMNSTPDPTITLITCAGDWIASEHQYSRRLIVTGVLKSVQPVSQGG